MGCDIHIYAEVDRSMDPYLDPRPNTPIGPEWKRSAIEVPDFRDYDAFAFLADVRNDGNIVPISIPRGIPRDTTIKDNSDCHPNDLGYCWLGEHSFSWVMLSEILTRPDHDKYRLIRKIIETFEKHENPEKTRLVFGFDS